MSTGPKGEKRPADAIARAVKVMRIATGEEPEDYGAAPAKNQAAAELGRRGGKKRADFTSQDVFDFTIDHLFRQRWKAIDDYGYFRHRSHDGARSCAIGVHMEDSEYDELFESVGVDIVVDALEPSLPLAQHLDAHLGLFLALQEFHDNEEIEDFSSPDAQAIVRKIARDFRLSADHVDWLYARERVVRCELEMA